jgi:hypothetical protein
VYESPHTSVPLLSFNIKDLEIVCNPRVTFIIVVDLT